MSTDPDFPPLAAAWLEGTATLPEQKLLGEILHSPDMMHEYAALCRTEAMLMQSGSTAARRTAELSRMLGRTTWPRRLLRICQRPAFRWSAAAAVAVALLAWALASSDSSSPPPMVKHPKPAPRSMPLAGPLQDRSMEVWANLPPADKSVEPWLRNYYVRPIPLVGPLGASVRSLAAEIKMPNGEQLDADPQTEGDAPVHLKTHNALPAWTILEILALQSGTELVVSGKRVVIRDAKRPLSLDGKLHDDQPRNVLEAALAKWSDQGFDSEWEAAGYFAKETIGQPLKFWPNGKDMITFNGSPRAVWSLGKICRAYPRAPQQLRWTVQVLQMPRGLFDKALAASCPDIHRTNKPVSISQADQQLLLRELSQQKGVDMMTLPIPVSDPGCRVEWTSNPEKLEREQDELSSALEGTVGKSGEIDMMISLKSDTWNESTRGWSSAQLETQVSVPSGQTVVLSGLIDGDGVETAYLVSAQIIDTTGPPKEAAPPQDNAPGGPPDSRPREELPYGIPVPDSPGMVRSPYAPEKGFIDVEGLKRDTRAMCPYTGKHFRVP